MANDFADRLDALEAKVIGLRDLPLAALQRKLESDWQPDPAVLLGDSSITTAMLLNDSVTFDKDGNLPLFDFIATSETRLNAAYGALTTPGPIITIPTAGDYIVEVGAYSRSSAAGNVFMSYDIGGTGAIDGDGLRFDVTVANNGAYSSRATKKTLAAGTVLTAKYRATAGTGLWVDRWMRATRIA